MEQVRCPKCNCEYVYADGNMWICPECAHEWSVVVVAEAVEDTAVRDAHGNELKDGDSIAIVKDLKIKGSSHALKVGTKISKIRIMDGGDGHNISCKIEGMGIINLKSEFVKKV